MTDDSPQQLWTDQPSMSLRYARSSGVITREIRVGGSVLHDAIECAATGADADGGAGFADWWMQFLRGKRPRSESLEVVRYIDLFSSVGGLSLGLELACRAIGTRARSLLAVDTDKRALSVYRRNIRPIDAYHGSVRDLVDFRLLKSARGQEFAYAPTLVTPDAEALHGRVDVVLAGPPCQGHSPLNNHSRHEDPRNLLYLAVPAVAIAVGATHVIIENVPTVTADRHGVVRTTVGLLRDAGYMVSSGVLHADRLGWPQSRRRYFVIASRVAQPISVEQLEGVFSAPALPVSWALDGAPEAEVNGVDVMNSVPQLSRENDMRVRWLHENGEFNLPLAIRPDCHKGGTTYKASYGRMYPDRPAPTLTGGFLSPGRGRFVHPTEPRVLTPREAARIQGFPDWFDFRPETGEEPTRTELARWIGNAVPSVMGFTAAMGALLGGVVAAEQRVDEVSSPA